MCNGVSDESRFSSLTLGLFSWAVYLFRLNLNLADFSCTYHHMLIIITSRGTGTDVCSGMSPEIGFKTSSVSMEIN